MSSLASDAIDHINSFIFLRVVEAGNAKVELADMVNTTHENMMLTADGKGWGGFKLCGLKILHLFS
jgi:hypothetical protein